MKEIIYKKKLLWQHCKQYTHHRIPGMIVTNRGTLLAYCEARTGGSDWCLMDIIVQRSTDHGETFEEPVVLASGGTAHPTVNNPVMVQDKNGRIHFMYCEDYGIRDGRIYRRYSDDDGITWSEKIDITAFTMPEYRNVFALGPGHGICTSGGMLLVPIWMVPKHYEAVLVAHQPTSVSTLTSLDNGETWQFGESLNTSDEVICPNETEAAETSDGRIYLNMRHMSMQRASAYSDTGYSGWYDYHANYDLYDPQCFASVISYNDGKHPYSLLFANCDSKEGRKNVTVKLSTDDGRSWTKGKQIEPLRGGYVEMAKDESNGLIYLLHEGWDKVAGFDDYLYTFNYEWLKN